MPAVHLEIFGMAGRVLGIDLLKSFEERRQIVWGPIPQRPTLLSFLQAVHDDDRSGASLRFRTRAIIGLAFGQHAATALRNGVERSRVAAGLAPGLLHQLQLSDGLRGTTDPVSSLSPGE